MASLPQALAWAKRGFRVFPLKPYSKVPAIEDFQNLASTDEHILRQWWVNPVTNEDHDFNIGVLTTGMVVVDVDVKGGKKGLEGYAELGGHYDTLVVRTPSGGYHCYFSGPDSRLMVGLRDGVDIRSHNGYVIAPGSYVIDEEKGVVGEYELLADKPIPAAPPAILASLKPPGEKREKDESVEYDTPTAVAQATAWLERAAPVAIEGQGGDSCTYDVSAKLVRDYALTPETAFQLLMAHWNERCLPPWSPDELWRKVENAEEYARGEFGAARAEAVFSGVEVPEAPAPKPIQVEVCFGNAVDPDELPPREWLVEGMFLERAVTLIAAAGGAGKSLFSLTAAAHAAVGRDFHGYKFPRPFKSIVYNAEDDVVEQSRRLLAICTAYQLDYKAVKQQILLLSSEEIPLTLAAADRASFAENETHIKWLIDAAADPDVKLIVLDPAIELHNCDENSPVHMKAFMNIIKRVAREANVSILLLHHTGKPNAVRSEAGDINTSRGSSAIPASARITFTLMGTTMEDRERHGIPELDKYRYVRLDDGKQNMSERNHEGKWFAWRTIKLNNGDTVGVIAPVDIRNNSTAAHAALISMVHDLLMMSGSASVSMQAAINHVQTSDALYEKYSDSAMRRLLQQTFSRPQRHGEDRIIVDRVFEGGRERIILRLV